MTGRDEQRLIIRRQRPSRKEGSIPQLCGLSQRFGVFEYGQVKPSVRCENIFLSITAKTPCSQIDDFLGELAQFQGQCGRPVRPRTVFSAPRLGNFALLRGKRPGGEPGLDRGREPRDVYQIVRAFARGIVIIRLPRPAFVGGKGSPCEKKKGSLCEEEK